MRNLNTVIFNSDLTVKQQTEKPIQAFSSYQNIVRAIVPYGTEYIPFAIFHATNDADDVSVPAQFILMVQNGTTTVDGEQYFVYEQKVPEAVVASFRATKVEFVLSLWGKETNFIGVQRYDETVGGYNDTTYIAGQLLNDFPNAEANDYVRVFNTETDWEFDGTVWADTGDTFESILEDYRSEVVDFALYRGKSTGKPTHKPSNTEAIIDAINLKVDKSGDTMTGALQFTNANATRLILGNNNVTTDGQVNATTFDNGDQVSDAVRFSDLATLFDVTAATPVDPDNWLDAYAVALTAKFDEFLTQATLGTAFLRTDGQNAMTGNLNMGGQQITNVGNVDGVDVSQLKADFDAVEAFFEVGDSDNAINKMQDIIAVFNEFDESFDLATALANKEDSANVGDRTYTNDYVVTDSETLTASIDALDTEAQRLEADKIDLDGENSSLTTLRYVHDDTDPNNIVYSTLTYDKDRQLLQYATPDGTTLQVGGELWFVNAKTNDALTHGDPVQFAGTQGDHFLVKKAVGGEIESNPDYFVGIATHDANANDFVKVTWFGEVSEIDTGSWSQGDILYFDKTTGGLVNTEPTTKPIIQVAAVTKVESAPSANDGRILVRPQFISRDAKEVFVDEVAGKYTADTLDGVLETLYDKTQAHEDLTNNPHQVTASQVNAIPTSEKGANNGVATLDSNGKVPLTQIPLKFDDVLQGYFNTSDNLFYEEQAYTNLLEQAEGKLYIDIPTNNIYRWDGSSFIAVITIEEITTLTQLPDVAITSVADNQILKYDSGTSKWVNVNHTLDEINDVNVSGASNGQYLTFDGTNWVATTLPTFSTTLADLDDTTITTPANNDFLVHDGTDWKNRAISKTDVDLNNVQNYGIASQAEAEAGTLDTKYMTPLKTKQSIEAATIDGGEF